MRIIKHSICMKYINNNLIIKILSCIVAFVMIGCDADNLGGGTPVLTLDCSELNLTGSGGDIPIYYGVKNSKKGEKPSMTTTADWITLKSVTSSQIMLTIAPNESQETREAILYITYSGAERQRVMVRQTKAVLDKFSFEASNVTYMSCTIKYIPADKQMQYMANIIDMAYFEQSGVDNEEAFLDAEMTNYRQIAASYQMSLEELLMRTELINVGDAERSFSGMQHGNRYVVYSYGLELNGDEFTLTTPIHYTIVELPMPTMYDITISADIVTNGSGGVTITTNPGKWDGYYNIQVAPEDSLYYVPAGSLPDSYTIRGMANAFFNTARTAMMQGRTAEGFLNSFCYRGVQNINLQLDAGKRYMIILFAVESEDGAIPVMRSIPSFYHVVL